ncbi:MAG: hypothetical protein ACFHWX_18615 [Bacteroidota bacterium]
MRKLAIFFLLLSNVFLANGQDKFAMHIVDVCQTLNFELTTDGIIQLESPDSVLLKEFKRCTNEPELAQLEKLNFKSIEEVKIAKIKSIKSRNSIYDRITCQQWIFGTTQQANDFSRILEQINKEDAQFCINKGGLDWWKEDNSIFVLTSRAYVSTFKYGDIRNIFVKNK